MATPTRILLFASALPLALACGAASARAEACLSVRPAQPGWNVVTAPDGFFFGDDLEQFRPGHPAIAWSEPASASPSVRQFRSGRSSEVELDLPDRTTTALKVDFAAPLDHVEVQLAGIDAAGREQVLFGPQRLSGASRVFTWEPARYDKMILRLSTHLRQVPAVGRAWLGTVQPVPRELVPAALWDQRLLFFRSPDGTERELCKFAPGTYQLMTPPQIGKPGQAAAGRVHDGGPTMLRHMAGVVLLVLLIGLAIEIRHYALRPRPSATR